MVRPALAYLAGVVTSALLLALAFLLEERRELARRAWTDDELGEDPGKPEMRP